MTGLTPKQAVFVEEYLIDLNATQAAIRAGFSAKTARQQAARMLSDVNIGEAVRKAMAARSERTKITADDVAKELARIGFADLRKAVIWRANVTGMVEDEDGTERLAVTNQVQLIDSDKLDDDTAAALASVSQTATGGLTIKLHDKPGALTQLGRHLGMFNDKLEVTFDEDRARRLAAARKRAVRGS